MANVVHLVPDVLEEIFTQYTLVHTNPIPPNVTVIEHESAMSGDLWTKQIEIMDRREARSCRPNHNLYSFLFVCRAWRTIALRHLYRSVAIGTNSRGSFDSDAAELLLRSLTLRPDLARVVRHLTLRLAPGRGAPDWYYDSQTHPSTSVAIIRLCTQVTNLDLWNYEGQLSDLYTALSGLTELESLTYGMTRFARIDAQNNFCTFSAYVPVLMPHWPKLRNLHLLSDSILYSDKVADLGGGQPYELHNIRMDKLAAYYCLPSVGLLKSLVASPIPLRVFRLWFPALTPTAMQSISRLPIRETLLAWSSSLQHLTLQVRGSSTAIAPLRILEEADAQTFSRLVELQTTWTFVSPSCLGHFAKLEFLAYDTASVEELKVLRRVVSNSKSLRYLTFFTEYPLAMESDIVEYALEDVENSTSSTVHVADLRAICARRNIRFSNTSFFDDIPIMAQTVPPPSAFMWDTSDDESLDQDTLSPASIDIDYDGSPISDGGDDAVGASDSEKSDSEEGSSENNDMDASHGDDVSYGDEEDEIEKYIHVETSEEEEEASGSEVEEIVPDGDEDGSEEPAGELELEEDDSEIESGPDDSVENARDSDDVAEVDSDDAPDDNFDDGYDDDYYSDASYDDSD